MSIPKKFYKTDDSSYPVVVFTVGELKEVIAELPDYLPINQDFSNNGGAIITVFNMHEDGSYDDAHLEFQEFEEDDWEDG